MSSSKNVEELPPIQMVENRGWKVVELNGKEVNIPTDWSINSMRGLFRFVNGSAFKPSDWQDIGTKIVRIQNLSNPKAEYNYTNKAPSEFVSINKGDILMSWSGTIDIFRWNEDQAALNQHIFRVDVNPETDNLFAEVILKNTISYLRSQAHGATMVHVRKGVVEEAQCVVPPRLEQTLIAQVLTNQESQVADLRKLAALERQRLAWLSDELLSGRLRVEEDPTAESVVVSRNEKGEPVEVLPGVSVVRNRGWKTVEVNGNSRRLPSDWDMVSLSEAEQRGIIFLGRGNVISKKDLAKSPGNFPVYSSSATGNGKFGQYSNYMFEEEMITWSIDGGGHFFYRHAHKYSVTNVCGWMRVASEKLNTKFAYLCLHRQQKDLVFDYQNKAHPSVIRRLYHLHMPPVEEQTLIAQVLTAQETQASEIERLADLEQKRLEWLSDELLSGRLRIQAQAEGQPNLLAAKDSIP